MTRGLLLSPLLIGLLISSGIAQESPSEDDSSFCSLSGEDLLVAIDGSWSLKQGSGLAMGGPIPIPLPSHGAQPVVFEYNPEKRFIVVAAADLSDSMVMFPSAEKQLIQAEELLDAFGKDDEKVVSDCDWDTLPILIGTNVYTGDYTGSYYGLTRTFCEGLAGESEEVTIQRVALGVLCVNSIPETARTLDMEMTLVIRFSDARHGSGVIYFDGEEDGYKYVAQAPITLSR